MTKHFCDGCKEELESKDIKHTKFHCMIEGHEESIYIYEFCGSCMMKVLKFIKEEVRK